MGPEWSKKWKDSGHTLKAEHMHFPGRLDVSYESKRECRILSILTSKTRIKELLLSEM